MMSANGAEINSDWTFWDGDPAQGGSVVYKTLYTPRVQHLLPYSPDEAYIFLGANKELWTDFTNNNSSLLLIYQEVTGAGS
jgi:hypothetical protein